MTTIDSSNDPSRTRRTERPPPPPPPAAPPAAAAQVQEQRKVDGDRRERDAQDARRATATQEDATARELRARTPSAPTTTTTKSTKPAEASGASDVAQVSSVKPTGAAANTEDLEARERALVQRAENHEKRSDAFVRAQAGVAQHNLQAIAGMMADARVEQMAPEQRNQLTEAVTRATPGGPLDMSAQDRDKLQAMAMEATRQARQDLRAGRVSATIDERDYQNVDGGAEAINQMRFDQALRDAQIPTDFEGHSPRNESELRALQAMETGTTTPEQDQDRAVMNARARNITEEDVKAPDSAERTARIMTDKSKDRGNGIGPAVPSMSDVPQEAAALRAELEQLNKDRADRGLPPVKLDALDRADAQRQQLDDAIAQAGENLYAQAGGLTTKNTPLMPFAKSNIADEQKRQRELTQRIERGDVQLLQPLTLTGPDGKPMSFEMPAARPEDLDGRQLDATLRSPLSQSERDELVRIADSRALLRDNTSGYSFKDIPMSPELQSQLGTSTQAEPPANLQSERFREMFGMHPTRDHDLTGLPTTHEVDRAALLPAEQRADYLRSVAERQRDRSEDAHFDTLALSQVDAEVLRQSSALDTAASSFDGVDGVVNYFTNVANDEERSARPLQAMDESSKLYHDSGERIGKAREAITDENYAEAMKQMRGVTANNAENELAHGAQKADINDTYRNMAMTMATLPFAVLPVVDTLGRVGGKALARTSRHVDDVGGAVGRQLDGVVDNARFGSRVLGGNGVRRGLQQPAGAASAADVEAAAGKVLADAPPPPPTPRAGGRDVLREPVHTEPLPHQKITDVGIHGQGGITRSEGEAINQFRDALNEHNFKFGLSTELPPTAGKLKETVAGANRAGDELAALHANIRRTDNAVNEHLTPDDLAGRLKEKRGVEMPVNPVTGKPYTHVQETDDAYQNLKKSVAAIDAYLAKNPNLPESQARYLLERRNGHAELQRVLETHLGFGR